MSNTILDSLNNCILVLGASGTGKTYSLRHMNWDETFLIMCRSKKPPFKGWKKNLIFEGDKINAAIVTDATRIVKYMNAINEKRPDIKNIIIDDMQYVQATKFMDRLCEVKGKGSEFDKFNEIGKDLYSILNTATKMRMNLNVIMMAHTDIDDFGNIKLKTVGKLVDRIFSPEGLCNVVIQSSYEDEKYVFITQKRNDRDILKSPSQMFPKVKMDNDLNEIIKLVNAYDDDGEVEETKTETEVNGEENE
jgi:hypothetical protein